MSFDRLVNVVGDLEHRPKGDSAKRLGKGQPEGREPGS